MICCWESLNTERVGVLCQRICVDRRRLGGVRRPGEVLGELRDRTVVVDGQLRLGGEVRAQTGEERGLGVSTGERLGR